MTDLPRPSKAPCGTCPYRRDVPSGIWHASEYEKLPRYDGSTMDQFAVGGTGLFFCHQNDGHLCAGWVGCHDMDEAVATRLHDVHPETFDYVSPVPLFASGQEAYEHGIAELKNPGREARAAMRKLQRRGI